MPKITIKGDSKGPIIVGKDIIITNSFNNVRQIVAKKQDISGEERNDILEKIIELENVLAQRKIDESKIEKLKKFFSKYKDIYPLILTAIQTVLSQL